MNHESQLIPAIARGEEFALEILFNIYGKKLLHWIIRRWNIALPDGEEILNDTFRRIFIYGNTYQGRGTLSSWIFGIAGNLCLNHLQKKKKEQNREEILDPEQVLNIPDPECIEKKQHLPIEEIMGSLTSLSTVEQRVMILNHIHGYKLKEIALMEGKSVEAVKKIHSRSIIRIREKIHCPVMNCKRAEYLLIDFIDGKLPPDINDIIMRHLMECKDCTREEDLIRRIINNPVQSVKERLMREFRRFRADSPNLSALYHRKQEMKKRLPPIDKKR